MAATKPETVSELTDRIKSILEDNLNPVYLTGEISNYKLHSSGHHYFSLKDKNAQISCVIWKSTTVGVKLDDGLKVVVFGYLTVYGQQGKYQVTCQNITPEGRGDLYLAYEQLKLKLQEKGYFDNSRKRSLPKICLKVGVSTSPTGAAVRDIFSTIQNRFPLVQIYFRPTLVQGDGSEKDVANAIVELNNYDLDAIIIGRGGGSIEDLWSYNTEQVANAIFTSKIPIISAVGHETDFTIADFVADMRAATPTAAAQFVTPTTIDEFQDFLYKSKAQIKSNFSNKISQYQKRLENTFQNSFYQRMIQKINFLSQSLDDTKDKMQNSMNGRLKLFMQEVKLKAKLIESLSPTLPLNKGFAIIKQNGRALSADEPPIVNKEIEIVRKEDIMKARITSYNHKIF
jgi:exodeoxyribonuclease VII large subunit